jgi:NTP pyrophosphatase (non-canonical NTP hydrolase)
VKFNDYQEHAAKFALYPGAHGFHETGWVYPVLGLCGEAGEVAEKIKKHIRDSLDFNDTRMEVMRELGDVLWYAAELARQWKLSLDDVAAANLAKLADRRARDAIHGSGDNR